MIQSSVTISLVPQARGGPFVFWDDLAGSCAAAADLGFDAVELFLPSADAVQPDELRSILDAHKLKLAAVGTGAGWVIHRLRLSAGDAAKRQSAIDFVRKFIDFGAQFDAPAIIGSMQGRSDDTSDRARALANLADAIRPLAAHAGEVGQPLLVEPLNRYETDLLNTIEDGVSFIESVSSGHVKLLADLFHMNIEETDIAAALERGGRHIGHLHFVDSNRRAAGLGHIDYGPIVEAVRRIDYQGYACAEALPLPDSQTAAKQTMAMYRRLMVRDVA